jgi:alpha-glucosidase (family GH31 glycosyl hydrolase)
MTSSPISIGPAVDPRAHPDAVIEGSGFRITVLSSRLLRLERSEDDRFTDGPTQLVRNRRFEVPEFTVADVDGSLDVWTSHLHLRYDQQPFRPAGLSVSMRQRAQDSHHTTWHFGDPPHSPDGRDSNLGGTLRTLDDVDGAVPLEPGLLSRSGYAVVDDSASLLLTDDGWVEPRPDPGTDLYFFGYGHDHQGALRDFFALTGPNPLLPRWALGNWWSRYHRYSDDGYLDLMDRFTAAGVPFSVGVLDMDWHLVDIDPALGTGWTGYTWNTDLFPDPAGFLRELHRRGLRVSLNVHPADGVRRHEAAYPAMARELGLDPDRGLEIAFDVTSREFVDAYFRHLHHPHERIGVDLWWLDWQSGAFTRVPGLDPLWMLNQLHYLDSGRDGRRPLTFSRYAGLGSHRYPIGFSGDTLASWESLDFQPYFTATAANVGYHWWSHDIGGHLGGARDDELAVRWLQFGVFSPINRLHSVKNPFNSKEPWRYGRDAEQVMTRYLRLRHQLVPYLYTAMWASHTDGVAPVRPMYHGHPADPQAYQVPNQYLFGADLVVAPITSPADPVTGHAETTAWLPDGTWFDVLTGHRYDGGRTVALYRTLDDIPVLAPAGAVLPLALDPMADVSGDPDELLVKVFAGAAGDYTLVEDDGSAEADTSGCRETRFSFRWRTGQDGPEADLRIDGPPGRRHLVVELIGVNAGDAVLTTAGAQQVVALVAGDAGTSATADLGCVDPAADLHIQFTRVRTAPDNLPGRIFAVLDHARIAYELKTTALELAERLDGAALLAGLGVLKLPGNLWGVLAEIISATTAKDSR